MPSRIIKESIRGSDTLASVSPEAERLFWRLVTSADDFGRFDGRPTIILGQCLTAFIETLTPPDVEMWLAELEDADLVIRYECDGKPYIALTKWDKHQQKRAKTSKFPEPPARDISCNQTHANVPVNENENVFENVNENEIVNGNEDENGESESAATVEKTDVQKTSSSSLDPVFGQVASLFQSEGFGMLSDTVREQLVYLNDEFGSDWLMMAMREAVLQNKRRMKYVAAILQNWRAEGGPRTSDNRTEAKSRGAPTRSGNSIGGTGSTANGQKDPRYAAFYELFPDA